VTIGRIYVRSTAMRPNDGSFCVAKTETLVKIIWRKARPHRRPTQTVQSYLAGGTNIPPCNTCLHMGPPETTTQTVSRSVHSSGRQSLFRQPLFRQQGSRLRGRV